MDPILEKETDQSGIINESNVNDINLENVVKICFNYKITNKQQQVKRKATASILSGSS